jgi:peptide/nickel transport system permease protein
VALRSRYELDRPLPVRYVHWVSWLLHGDMGFSFAYNTPVAPLVLVRARNTLLLTVTAMLLAWGGGSAVRHLECRTPWTPTRPRALLGSRGASDYS